MREPKFKVGDKIEFTDRGIRCTVLEFHESVNRYEIEVHGKRYQVERFKLEKTHALVGSIVINQKQPENSCSHPNKYIVHMQSFKSFVTCPNCHTDLGDA